MHRPCHEVSFETIDFASYYPIDTCDFVSNQNSLGAEGGIAILTRRGRSDVKSLSWSCHEASEGSPMGSLRIVLTFVLLAGVTGVVIRESRAFGDDLVQDYVAARAWLDGEFAYQTLDELRVRVGFEPRAAHVLVRYNPHPPGAVLLTAPFARLEFAEAFRFVKWVQLLALSLAWEIAYRLLGRPGSGWVWAGCGGLYGLWSPFWQGLDWGQPVGILALAGVGMWAAARTDRPILFGLILGAACTVRPFFAISAVVAAGWSRRRASLAFFGALVGGFLPFAVVQISPWTWYRLASDAGEYVTGCGSIPGVLGFSPLAGIVTYAVTAVVLLVVRYRGSDTDATIALAAVSAMLAYPLAWFQYDVSLIGVIAWLAVRATREGERPVLFGLAGFLLLRSLPDVQGVGASSMLGRLQPWIQVAGRVILLATVIVVAVRSRRGSVSEIE
jgi:hypothetical protein